MAGRLLVIGSENLIVREGMMPEHRSAMMTGLFRDRDSAERAYETLCSGGYGKDDVSLLMSEGHFPRDGQRTELGTKAAQGAGVGAVVGGGLGRPGREPDAAAAVGELQHW